MQHNSNEKEELSFVERILGIQQNENQYKPAAPRNQSSASDKTALQLSEKVIHQKGKSNHNLDSIKINNIGFQLQGASIRIKKPPIQLN